MMKPTEIELVKNPATPSATFAVKTVEQTISELTTDIDKGLSSDDVDFRRKRYGKNELEMDEDEPLWKKFLEQLKQPLILLLLGSAAISMCLGSWDDAFSITLVPVKVSPLQLFHDLADLKVAFIQEYRSEKSLEALNKLVPNFCHVLRDSHYLSMLAQELVPGDVVKFTCGDRIPADIRLIKSFDLDVDESNLTGETRPARKSTGPIAQTVTDSIVPVTDRKNIVFMGTLVRGGNGVGVVVGTAKDTEFGSIWAMMKDVNVQKTPLQVKMEQLGKHLSLLSFGVISVITIIGLAQGKKWLETFTIAVSLAVAAIPEGLPIVVTVTLALGVMRMAKKKAIVKRLPSVESLGSVSVICADKTGTLTQNQMVVTQLFTIGDGLLRVDKNSDLTQLVQRPTVQKLVDVGTLCNNATLRGEEALGQPTEIALLKLGEKLKVKDSRQTHQRIMEVPFSSESKMMSVQCKYFDSSVYFVKGAPEILFARCSKHAACDDGKSLTWKPFTADVRRQVAAALEQMASFGLRVIALAYGSDMTDLVFAGLVAMNDPPRPGVAESIDTLLKGGVRVVMITGDSEGTAVSVARQLGITSIVAEDATHPAHVSGQALDSLSEREMGEMVKNVSIFYRTTPRHKLHIVKALQAAGQVVAMTGDGVNDAPALKLADIGISMGESGTDVSKEAADVILVNDDFTTILAAIEEGKSIFYNIRNFLKFQLSTSVAALTLVAASTLMGFPTPLNAMQILWINIIMDGPPAQSLGVESVDPDVMKKPPRAREAPILDRQLWTRVITSAAIIVCGTMYIFFTQMIDGTITAKDTTMTFTTFIFFDMFNCISSRSERKSIFKIGFFSNRPLLYAVSISIVCQLLVIYTAPFQKIFQTEALSAGEMLRIIAISSTVFIFDELRKLYLNVMERGQLQQQRKGDYEIV